MKVGDIVKVIAGNKKGTEAKIVKVDAKNGKAMLEGVGVVERHLKKSYLNPQGGKKSVHVGIDLSNLKLVKAGEAAKKTTKTADKPAKNAKAKKGAK